MAIKKRMVRNKPFQDDLGIYTYLSDNNSALYKDSDSVPINADKFVDKDLYSSFVGNSVNEAILESKVDASYDATTYGDELQYLGNTSIKIQSLNIVNRGVNSKINDVYFRFFIFSQDFFNPYNTNGSLRGYNALRDGMQGKGDTEDDGNNGAAWFYSQNGPNYGEGDAPGDFQGIRNLSIVENFDTLNYGPDGDNSFATFDMEWGNKRSSFNPIRSIRKKNVTIDDEGNVNGFTGYENDRTTLFQENGAENLVFFGIHMDGDQDIWPWDRSRNQTINLYAFDPRELFTSSGAGKITILEWDEPTETRYSSGDRAPAFIGKEFRMIIDTSGGVDLEQGYSPSPKYQNILNEIQYPLYPILTNQMETELDHVMLNMFPFSQIQDTVYYDAIENDELTEDTTAEDLYLEQKYLRKFSDFAPTPIVRLFADTDLQAYYQSDGDRLLTSAPNSVELNFNVCVHPLPYRDGLTLFNIVQPELNYINGEEILIDPNNTDGSIPDVNTIVWTGDYYEITYDSIPLEIVSITGEDAGVTLVRDMTTEQWTLDDGTELIGTPYFNNGGTFTFEISGVQTIYWNQQILIQGSNLSETVELIQKTRWDSYNDVINPIYDGGLSIQYNDIITGQSKTISQTNLDQDYIYFVVDWNDSDDKFKTINDVLADWPRTKQQLLDKRNENLYIPKYINNKNFGKTFDDTGVHLRTRELKNTYNTSGIKTIKSIMFSTNSNTEKYIEPFRWKLVTTRIFLDLPSTEFPDFNELGGNDYTTIPWPNTNPVIGGISQDSKYLKSVQDTLSGGKVGNQDIIDETFLINAKENNELGKNIEKMDLEQIRYFNKSYDINTLLKVLSNNPQYFPTPTLDTESNLSDIFDYDDDDMILEYDSMMNEYTATVLQGASNGGDGEEFSTTITGLYDHILKDCNDYQSCYDLLDVNDLTQWYQLKFTYMGTEEDVGGETNSSLKGIGIRFKNKGISIQADDWDKQTQSPYDGTTITSVSPGSQMTMWIYGDHGNDYQQQQHPDFWEQANCVVGEECVVWVHLFPAVQYFNTPSRHEIQFLNGQLYDKTKWKDISLTRADSSLINFYDDFNYWDGLTPTTTFPEESSVGQIFIDDNLDVDLKQNCKIEFNLGDLSTNVIDDSNGNGNKGFLIGDYRIKKNQKNKPMTRDSFIKIPKKTNNRNGAL